MPQNAKGCYEKIGYPRVLRLGGDEWTFVVSGATRMVYQCEAHPEVVAKVMPAKASPYWREGWDQNSMEAAALAKVRDIPFAPRVFGHFEQDIVNKWNQADKLDVLCVTKLGSDLQTAIRCVSLEAYCKAYKAALWATKIFAEHDVIVADPHPYNCSLYRDRHDLALPCDFGSASGASVTALRKSLKALCAGFKSMVREAYGIDLTASWPSVAARISTVELPIQEDAMKDLGAFFSLAKATTPATAPADVPRPAPQTSPEPMPEPAPMAAESFVGKFVLLNRLEEHGELNGCIGFVQRIASNAQRCEVKLQDNKVKSIHASKLSTIAHPSDAWVCRSCKANAYYKHCPEGGWTGRRGKWHCPACSKPPPSIQPSRRSTLLAHLGLSPTASPEDVRQAYKRWLLVAHPDKGGDSQHFAVNNQFWQELL